MKKDKLIIHCSDTKPSMSIGVKEIRKWHTDPKPKGNGWSDIGYPYVITRDGTIEPGRPADKKGAHARGYNDRLGICLVGGMSEDGKPECNFTYAQYYSLIDFVDTLKRMDMIDDDCEILGHRDLPGVNKECPCFDVKSFFG